MNTAAPDRVPADPPSGHVPTGLSSGRVPADPQPVCVRTDPPPGHVPTGLSSGRVPADPQPDCVRTDPPSGRVPADPQPDRVPTDPPPGHVPVTPSILYFGTPVVLLSTENENGSFNLAPMSSAWALGQVIVLGLGAGGQTARNLRSRRELVVSLPASAQWAAVERLAPLTGRTPVPEHKRGAFRFEPDKFAAAGLRPEPSELVRPPRVAECPMQLEARVARARADASGDFLIVEARVLKVHADPRIVVPGSQHIDPAAWSPLIYNFRHYYGLGPELGHSFRSGTA